MRQIVFLVMMMLGIAQAVAQDVKRPETYNYLRGVEAYNLGQTEEAIEYFNKDIAENPKNGYSYCWLGAIYSTNGEYGRALDAANQAIKLLPRKDTEYLGFAYAARFSIYVCMGDTTQALADICQAIKQDKMTTDYLKDRAQIYYEQGRLDLADADYRKMIELKPGDVIGYMGLGRIANKQKRWEDAIRQFDIVTKLASEYSQGYSFRAEAYNGLEKWDEATDDIVKALDLSWSNNMNDMKAWELLLSATEPAFSMLVTKIKVQSAKAPNEFKWPYDIACMYDAKKDYAKALEYFLKANEKEISLKVCTYIAECHQRLGNYDEALLSINQALNMDSTDWYSQTIKADIYRRLGDMQTAIKEFDKVVEMYPDHAWGYYRRGWVKAMSGDFEGGLEDETTAIVLAPKQAYYYNTRGDIYLKLGKKEQAENDFRKVIELEDSPEKYECVQFAYHRLGQDDKAKEVMDLIIAKDTTDNERYYRAACLYSLMKDKENALKYLEKALALGWNSFGLMEVDFYMEFLRRTAEYKQLVEKYRQAKKKSARTPSSSAD